MRSADANGHGSPASTGDGVALLSVEGVHKRFGGVAALAGVSLSLAAGRALGITGANGAGKTTLFDIICGRLLADAGEVFFGGRRITGRSPEWIGRQGLVRTFQESPAPDDMAVVDYLSLARDPGWFGGVASQLLRPAAAWRRRMATRLEAADLLDRHGLGPHAERPCRALSAGEWKFVTLLRAFHRRPRALLLDEPSTALNANLKSALVDLAKRFVARGGAIAVISHDNAFTRTIADEVIHLSGGVACPAPDSDWGPRPVIGTGSLELRSSRPRQRPPVASAGGGTGMPAGPAFPVPGSPSHPPVLSVRDVGATAGGRVVLRGVSLDLGPGEVLGIIGANGAGKSTLLRSLLGLVPRTSGSVVLAGRPLDSLPPHRAARAGLGLALQGARIPPRLTVDEAVRMAWALGDVGDGARATSVAWKSVTGYDTLLLRTPVLLRRRGVRAGLLSGGEQGLLATVMAMAHRPAVLMLDEPSVGLQRQVLLDLFQWLCDLSTSGLPLIIVEQDVEALMSVATRIATLAEGRLTEDPPSVPASSPTPAAAVGR